MMTVPVYLDCNATAPLDPEVFETVREYLTLDFGNAASRTHEFGVRAKRAVEAARGQVATALAAQTDEVIFTSGATESDNLAILGLAAHGQTAGKRHIVTSATEHKAVLEPIAHLATLGFEVTLLKPDARGWVDSGQLSGALRPDTLLVSLMHANNETGIIQPVEEYAKVLKSHTAFFHVDAAQTFGKLTKPLRDPRIDLVSVSGHKVYAPKGIGALVVRRRGFDRVPLRPLTFGGGHERGLRPGTLPVHLIAGLGKATELALRHEDKRREACGRIRREALERLAPLQPIYHGDQERCLPHVLNVAFPGLDSEAVIVALKDTVAISNGSACTSHSYEPSHVLQAMGLPKDEVLGAIRISWCHLTAAVPWDDVVSSLRRIS